MKSFAILLGLLMAATPALASSQDLLLLEQRIEAIGAKVLWSDGHGVCSDRDMLGKYVPSQRTVYICQENLRAAGEPSLNTLQHEGWHAVQHLCNGNNAALTDGQIRELITSDDRDTIKKLYPAHQWRAEAEARALENVPINAFINGVNSYCSEISRRS
jgi:hypothetical protein